MPFKASKCSKLRICLIFLDSINVTLPSSSLKKNSDRHLGDISLLISFLRLLHRKTTVEIAKTLSQQSKTNKLVWISRINAFESFRKYLSLEDLPSWFTQRNSEIMINKNIIILAKFLSRKAGTLFIVGLNLYQRSANLLKKLYFPSITKRSFKHIFILTASDLGIIIRLSKLIIAKAYLATHRPNKWYTLFTRKFFQIRP